MCTEDSVEKIALKILRYLAEHPNAADTAEGILQWWLLERTIIEEEEAVKQSLEHLVEQGLIVAVQSSDARRHYRLNAEKIDQTHNLLGPD